MKFSTINAVCLGVALFFSRPSLWAEDGKSLILGGAGIGQVQLQMRAGEVAERLGAASSSDQDMNLRGTETWLAKSPDGKTQVTQVWMTHVNYGTGEGPAYWEINQVAVTSPFFRTHGGNSTDSNPDAIWREYPDLRYLDVDLGDDLNLELYDSTSLGIAFLIERHQSATKGEPWGKCRAIIVHLGGREPNTTALAFMVKPSAGG